MHTVGLTIIYFYAGILQIHTKWINCYKKMCVTRVVSRKHRLAGEQTY